MLGSSISPRSPTGTPAPTLEVFTHGVRNALDGLAGSVLAPGDAVAVMAGGSTRPVIGQLRHPDSQDPGSGSPSSTAASPTSDRDALFKPLEGIDRGSYEHPAFRRSVSTWATTQQRASAGLALAGAAALRRLLTARS
jgi:hypothetical protein